jgi:hypothetical protein
MTTDRLAIHRVRATEMAYFASLDLPGEVGALIVGARRSAAEPMAAAVARASGLLEAGLVRAVPAEEAGLWLLALGNPTRRAHRVAALLALRAGLWGALEQDDVGLPEGSRAETVLDYPVVESTGFGGSIALRVDDLTVALEVTRTQNALCVAGSPAAGDPLGAVVAQAPVRVASSAPDLLVTAIPLVVDRTALPGDVGVLLVDAHRAVMEPMTAAVARASDLFTSALARSVPAGQSDLWLLALGNPVRRSQRLGTLLATRAGLWNGLEKNGAVLPGGSRSEISLDYADGDAWGFVGSIRFPLGDLPAAIELTRTHNAMVVATEPAAAEPVSTLVADCPQLVDGRTPRILFRTVSLVDDGTWPLAARGFGAFDDVSVGAEMFGHAQHLDPVEAALRDLVAEHVGEP